MSRKGPISSARRSSRSRKARLLAVAMVATSGCGGGSGLWGVGPDLVESGQWAGATLIGDLACAIRTVRHDAAPRGGDTDRLLLVGYSMGATFGATLSIVGDDPGATSGTSGSCAVLEGSAMPAAFLG